MAYINFQSVEQLKALSPAQRNEYLLWLAGNGIGYDPSGHGGSLISLANDGKWGEIAYQIPFMENEIRKFTEGRATEYTQRVKEYASSGTTPPKEWETTAREAIKQLNQTYALAPSFVKGEAPPTYEQLYQTTKAVNPYSKEGVVGSKEYEQMAAAAQQGQSEPVVGMRSSTGEVKFIPQSQVEQVKSQGWSVIPPVGGASSAGGSATSPSASGASSGGFVDPTGAIPKADQNWVNSLYQKFFDRDATSAELANWTKESPQALEQFLGAEAVKYNYRSKYFSTQDTSKLQGALSVIDSSNLPPDIKELWRSVVQNYPPGVEYDTAEILNTFNKIKAETIDPYFKQLADTAANDIRSSMSQLDQARALELEQQRTSAGNNIRQAKEGLEKSGMTFTGKAIETLGAESAYAQPGANPPSAVPTQTPFGGLFYEGTVNQGNRLMASSSEARAAAARENAARQAENLLGTAGAKSLGVTEGLAGGVTGSLDTQKQQQYSSTLNQLIANYRQKQDALTNKTY